MIKLWWAMCCSPKETIKRVLNQGQKRNFFLLAVVYGLPIVFHLMQEFSLGNRLPLGLLLIFGLLFALPVGVIGIYIVGFILYWVGRPLKGRASQQDLRITFAWSNVPLVITFIAWMGLACVFGSRLFLYSFVLQEFTYCEEIVVFIFALIQFAATVWSFFLLIKALTVVQHYAISKAVINVVLPFLIFLAWVAFVS